MLRAIGMRGGVWRNMSCPKLVYAGQVPTCTCKDCELLRRERRLQALICAQVGV